MVVGIDHYPKFRSLEGARQDAQDFTNWLLDSTIGGALPTENVRQVLSKENPTRPVHEDIDDALEEIFDATDQNPAQRLYFYFSGHGLARSNTGIDLCLAKWSKRRMGRALDSQDYLELAMESGRFREIVMFMDCCRIRKIRRRTLSPTIDVVRPDEDAAKSRSFVGYATEFLNAAHEAATDRLDQDEDSERPIVRGHFTRALMDALHGKAAEATGGIRASRLKEYLELKTPEIARQSNHNQKPEIVNGLGSDPEPLFGSARAPESVVTIRITFLQVYPLVILEDGNLNIVKSGNSGSGPWTENLKRGNYLLRAANGTKQINIRITGDEEGIKDVQF